MSFKIYMYLCECIYLDRYHACTEVYIYIYLLEDPKKLTIVLTKPPKFG